MEETNNTNNSKAVWLTIVFVLLAVGLWSVVGGNPLKLLGKKEEVKKEVDKVETLSIDNDLAMFERRSNFPKVTVKSSVKSSMKELGSGLEGLILPEGISPEITRVTYGDGSTGWGISYQYEDNVMNVYNKMYSLVRDNKFEIDFASRTFSAAIVSGNNSSYKVKAIAQYLGDKSALVRINIIKK